VVPERGYPSIIVSNEVYERLKRHAEETHRTVPKLIEHLLDRLFPEPGEGAHLMVAVSMEEARSQRPRRSRLMGIMSSSIPGLRELSKMIHVQLRRLRRQLKPICSRAARGVDAAPGGRRLSRLPRELVLIEGGRRDEAWQSMI